MNMKFMITRELLRANRASFAANTYVMKRMNPRDTKPRIVIREVWAIPWTGEVARSLLLLDLNAIAESEVGNMLLNAGPMITA